MVITLTVAAAFVFALGFGWQMARARWFRHRYRSELKKHTQTAETKAEIEGTINSMRDTVDLARQIIADYQNGCLKKHYRTTEAVADMVEWPDEIEEKES